MSENALTVQQNDMMPAMDVQTAIVRRDWFVGFVKSIMSEGTDYGTVPGTDKPTLLKPGAEKLSTFFGFSPAFEIVKSVEDWDKPLFHYQYKCKLYKGDRLMGEGVGSCNSMETKYRWRWVSGDDLPNSINPDSCGTRRSSVVEFAFAIEKAETGGKYGKPAEYWNRFQVAIENGEAKPTTRKTRNGNELEAYEIASVSYRIPNDEVYSQINTIDKMAQKRALVAAVLVAVNASEFFTQDLEDMDISVIDTTAEVLPESKPEQKKQEDKPAPAKQEEKGKPFKFPSAAAEKFYNDCQRQTGNRWKNEFHFLKTMENNGITWAILNDDNEKVKTFEKLTTQAEEESESSLGEIFTDNQTELPK